MSTIVTRAGKGSPLTHTEVDNNFTNINTDKVEKTSADITGGSINGTTIGASTASTGAFTSLTSSSTTTLNGTTIPSSKTLVVTTDIGSTVQAYDAQLADVAGLTPTDNSVIIGNGTNFVVESGSTLRTSLGLAISTDVQAYSAELQGASQGGINGFKNRIINGAMVIDQRNAGASVSTDSSYPVDRFVMRATGMDELVFSAAQDSSAPAGFVNSLKVTISTAETSFTTTEQFLIRQLIEGNNIADLAWGTANAQPVTLSFWVRSSLTGTFSGSLLNSGLNRSYPFTYTISTADTWEQKSVTLAGDTSGTWLTTNGVGISVNFALGIGPDRLGTAGAWNSNNNTGATGMVQLGQTSGATFYITGVQLEKGSTATSFDYRPYGTELSLCQRYFQRFGNGTTGQALTPLGSGTEFYFPMPVQMRATPTPSYANAALVDTVNPAITVTGITTFRGSTTNLGFYVTASGTTNFRPYYMIVNSTGGYLDAAAEL